MDSDKLGRTLGSPVSKSILGFLAALVIGALLPPATKKLIRQVMVRSVKDILVLALAGLLTERVAGLLGSHPDDPSYAEGDG
ncbi:MAG: hypothetical protein HKN17_08500 [Rhodothermales bacterium]|nr:hypothetical protein [Rhodothermales bacterium]